MDAVLADMLCPMVWIGHIGGIVLRVDQLSLPNT